MFKTDHLSWWTFQILDRVMTVVTNLNLSEIRLKKNGYLLKNKYIIKYTRLNIITNIIIYAA